jgi:PAS domain S-box-containing protein
MTFRIPKIKLGNKIALIYFILGFVSLTAINLIWLLPSLSETKKNAANLQLEIAKRGASEIGSFLNYKIDSLKNLNLLIQPSQTDQNAEIFNSFLQKDQSFFEIALLDETGAEQIRVSQFEIFTKAELVNRSTEEYFQDAITGTPYISHVFFNDKAEPYLILAIPIYSSVQEKSNVLMAKLKLTEIWQIVSGLKVGLTSRSFVVDEEGRLIADPNPSLVLKNMNLSNLAPVKKIIGSKQVVDGLATDDIYLNDQGQSVLAVGVPLEGLNWGLIIERPEADAYIGLTSKITAFIMIFVLGGLAIFVVARFLAIYLFGPMKKLGDGAKIIGAGNLDYRLNITTGDEIEELAESFNDMALQLKDYYIDLEQKVEERTKELKVQRDQLDSVTKNLIRRDVQLNETRDDQEKALIQANESKKKADEARLASLNILEDIEEARKAQEDEKNKIEAVLKSLTDGLIMLDQFGWVSLVNDETEAMLGIKKEEILSKRLGEIDKPDIQKISEALNRTEREDEKIEVPLEGTDERILEITTAPVVGIDKKTLGKVIILHDVTREKAIERMKTEFVTIAAHQLRTPLSAVKWTLRLILDGDIGPISQEQSETLQKGYQSNERMISLVNDLLNVARIEEGRFVYGFTKISFSDLVNETIDSFQTTANMKNIRINFKKPETGIDIMADKEKIKLAVQNLIENAINYSPSGSDVTILLDCDKMNLTLGVRDQGMGIPRRQQERVFSKFFRGENAIRMETEGTGLGLFLTKNIVEKHGGKIWFETEEGKGSTFFIRLPIAK